MLEPTEIVSNLFAFLNVKYYFCLQMKNSSINSNNT